MYVSSGTSNIKREKKKWYAILDDTHTILPLDTQSNATFLPQTASIRKTASKRVRLRILDMCRTSFRTSDAHQDRCMHKRDLPRMPPYPGALHTLAWEHSVQPHYATQVQWSCANARPIAFDTCALQYARFLPRRVLWPHLWKVLSVTTMKFEYSHIYSHQPQHCYTRIDPTWAAGSP